MTDLPKKLNFLQINDTQGTTAYLAVERIVSIHHVADDICEVKTVDGATWDFNWSAHDLAGHLGDLFDGYTGRKRI